MTAQLPFPVHSHTAEGLSKCDAPTFGDLLNREFRWPRRGDKPFIQSERWQVNAYLVRANGWRFWPFADSRKVCFQRRVWTGGEQPEPANICFRAVG
jgi:hypothetical protein